MAILRAYGLDVYDTFAEFLEEEAVSEQLAGQKTFSTTLGRFGGGRIRIEDDDRGIEISIPNSTTIFFGVSIKYNSTWSAVDDFMLLKSGTTSHIVLQTIATGPRINVFAGGVIRGSFRLKPLIWHRLEIKGTIDDTTGNVTVRVDGVDVVIFEGDTQSGADSFVDIVEMDGTTGSTNIEFDDITVNDDQGGVNDDFLGDLRIDTLRPTAETGLQDLTPSSGTDNSAMVDEAPGADDDTTYVSSATAADQDLYDAGATGGLDPFTIHGIVVRGKVKKDDAASRSIKFLANTGTIGVSSAFILTTTYQYADGVFNTDPSTSGAPFTRANADAIQIGVEIV